MTRVTQKLAENYARSNYLIMVPDGVILVRPWVENKSLCDLHKDFGAKSSAIISPCNPHSKKLTDQANEKLLKSFARKLKRWVYFPCAGSSLGSGQKSEKSYFILDISKDEALKFGRELGQHAILFCEYRRQQILPELLACQSNNQRLFQDLKKQRARTNVHEQRDNL